MHVIWVSLLLASGANKCSSQEAGDAGFDVEVRVVWGGAIPREFDGTIGVSSGNIFLVRNLSLEADSIGKIRPQGPAALRILPCSPSSFGGADLRIRCPSGATISFRFTNPLTGKIEESLVTVAELLTQDWQQELDDRGSRLAISRLPHDKLRISLNSDSEIWDVGSTKQVSVTGVHTGLDPGRYSLRLFLERNEESKSIGTLPVELDARGGFAVQRFTVVAPTTEGAFRIRAELTQARLFSPLNPLAGAKLERSLDVVVFDKSKGPGIIGGWLSVAGINALDASKPGYFSWLAPISEPISYSLTPITKTLEPVTPQAGIDLLSGWQSLNPLSGSLRQPIKKGELAARTVSTSESQDSAECLTLGVGAWLAIPMQGLEPGIPHRIRVRTPRDRPQQLAVGIKSSRLNPAGRIRVGDDYLLEVQQRETLVQSLQETELLFWPTSEDMLLVLSNASSSEKASVLDVFVDRATMESRPTMAKNPRDERKVGVYLDKPLLADFFACALSTDNVTQRELEDWNTWKLAVERLCQYTSYAEANLIVLKTQSDGGAIFDSQVLRPSRRYDGGTFFSDGRSPEIKDAVALLLRYAERYGIEVVVSLDLSVPLPALSSWEDRPGIFQERLGQDDGSKKYYNPLHPNVQSTLSSAIRELVERYGSYRSFAGVQLDLKQGTPLVFAGDRWGYGADTLAQYQRDIQANLPKSPEQRIQMLSGAGRLSFLNWRAEALSKLYDSLANTLGGNGSRKLYLNALPLWNRLPDASDYINPDAILRNSSDLLLASGIAPRSLNENKQIVLLQGNNVRADAPRDTESWMLSEAAKQALNNGDTSGALVVERPLVHNLHASEHGDEIAGGILPGTLFPINVGAGLGASKRILKQAFATDLEYLAVGAWLPISHPNENSRRLYRTLRALPATTMREFPANRDKENVKVRTAYGDDNNYIQIVNNSPWPERITLGVQFDGELPQVEVLGQNRLEVNRGEALKLGGSRGQAWDFEIAPFDIVGLRITRCLEFRLREVNHAPPQQTVEFVSAELQAFEEVVGRAADPRQQKPLAHLFGEFEQWDESGKPVGWTVSSLPNIEISRAERLPKSGRTSLQISNRNEGSISAWIQSRAIRLPDTGRMVLQAWLRVPPRQGDIRVRLSVLGRQKNGARFERAVEVGDLQSAPISNDWGGRPFTLYVNDLPREQLSELFVAVEVVGRGTVWLDDLEVLQTWLLPNEKIYLQGLMFVAKQELTENNPYPAEQLLAGHWGSYFAAFQKGSPSASTGSPIVSDAPRQTPNKTSSNWFQPPKVFQQLRDSMFGPWQR